MPDIKDMEGPVKFKKGIELYFDPKKDMFYDPKKKKYMSEKDILKLEDVDFDELETIEEGVYDPSIFKAIFMAGGPGSGKSYVSNKVTAGLGMKVVNSDDIFEIFLKKAGMTTTAKDIFSDKGQEIRGRAKGVTSKRMKLFLDSRLGLLIDGTGKDYDNIKKKSDRLKELGYDTYMVFVNTSLEIAQERNAARSRKLDPKEVEKMWRSVQENIGKFQKYFGARNMIIVDNNAADENYLTDVYKQVKKLIKKPAQSRIAKSWISKALDDKVRKEEVELLEKSEEYQKFFQSALKKFGIDSPAELSDEKKKEFFDYVDKNWEGENEEDEEETVEENCHSKHKKIKEDEEFKPHMMYDPKTGKAYKAEKPEDHERMSKLGYTHKKPKKIEELSIEERYDIKTRLKVHKAMMKKYGNDPYYKQVIDAILSKGTSDMEKAIKSLISIRGAQALKNLQSDMKSMLGETVEESRIRLSSLMNGGALLYDRDEDPDDDKLATVKVKGNPKKDIKNGDDLVLSLMDKGKSKEKEILKSLKKYYPKSKVVKEENIEEVKMHPALRKLQTALKKFHKGSELDDLVPEYGAKIVDGKKVYHIEYKKGKKEGEEFAKSLQKALKASSFSVTPTYRGDDSVVSIEIKEETISPKIAAYLNFLNKNLEEGKKDYEIYHNTFSSAIDEVKKFAKKNGYELDDDDLFHKVGTGPKKPSTGKTNKYHLKLIKGGKENKKLLHFQVYGMKSQYELNMYIS